jgi:hypothetical protein
MRTRLDGSEVETAHDVSRSLGNESEVRGVGLDAAEPLGHRGVVGRPLVRERDDEVRRRVDVAEEAPDSRRILGERGAHDDRRAAAAVDRSGLNARHRRDWNAAARTRPARTGPRGCTRR